MWESNSPKKLLTPHAGFEDQRAHQDSSTPIMLQLLVLDDSSISRHLSQGLKIGLWRRFDGVIEKTI